MNTNMTPKKRILAALLTVILVFSMMPLSVFAADGNQASVTVNKTETEYATIQEAFDAAKKLTEPCTVKVLQSFKGSMVLGVTFTAEDNCDITLDVNGFDMYNRNTRDQASASMFTFEKGTNAHLTVVNNSENRETLGGIFYYPNGTDISNSVFYMEGGTLTIEDVGGDGIKNKTSNYDKISGSIVYLDGGDVIINGSKFGEENNIVPLYVKSGNLTVNGGKFISQQGNALWIAEGFDGNVSLSGGRFSSTFTSSKMDEKGNFVQVYSIPSILREDGGKVDDLLAKGYVYQKNADDEKNSESALYREISVVPEPGVKYIAADGTEQSCTEYTELTESTDGSTGLNGWYVVKGTVNKEGLIGIAGGKTLNLILCEGATLNLQKTLYLMGGATLNIYGQNGGTGTLIVKGTAGVRQPGIGIMHNTAGGSASVNIYGGTVTAQTDNGAQPIGTNPELMPYGKVTVTIAKGLKCVKTDDQNTAYAYDNTDGTSITITKCTEHKWSYTNITNDTHDRTCDLCGTAETGVAHTTARYQYIRADIHRLICACGKGYSTEYHTYTYAPNSDGLTHTATCKCEYSVDDIAHTYKGEDEICICGAVHSATYDGKKYASLQSAIDAAAPVGGTVTLARQVNENVVSTDGTVTIDLGGNRWRGYIDDWGSIVPLAVNGGSVTLKNGNLFQWWSSSSARTGIEINDGSVTIEEDVRVMGGIPEGDVLSPSITLNGGTLILKEGAVLLSGLQVPEGKVLADYLPEGTAFVKCSYDNSSDTVTVSDPQEFVSDVYSTNRSTEGMMIVSHTHDFGGGTACPCGFNCDHSVVDSATGKCENCGTQVYIAIVTDTDGSYASFASFDDAWIAAVSNEGSTLKLLCDITLDEAEDGIIAQSGKFTLDLNGKTVSGEITNQLLTVIGTADITIRNGKLINTFSKDSSDINQTCANALAIDGGTVTLDVVELTAGHGFKGARSCAAYIFSGSLTVVNGTFTGQFGVADVFGVHPSVKITSATLHDGIYYDRTGITAIDYAGLKALFADGSMLFDKDGKYIDVEDEAYWRIDGEGENTYVSFGYSEECVIKPHTHDTYVDGKCAECAYACPHDSGKNDREASYFEKAICAVCHSEYGEYVQDTTAPTGKIEIRERTWWQGLLNKITFGLFYKETVTLAITGQDDSGRDVVIRYTIESAAAEDAEALVYAEYTGTVDLSDERQYVIYAYIEDWAGNKTYLSSDGFEIDKTAPVVEVVSPVSRTLYDGGAYVFCTQRLVFRAVDKNLVDVTAEDENVLKADGEGNYVIESAGEHELVLTDLAGNESRIGVMLYAAHDFDQATGKCRHCGTPAAAKVESGELTAWFADGDELFKALGDAKYNGATVTLLTDLTFTEKVSPSGDAPVRNDLTFDLNGKTLQGPENGALVVFGGAVRIWSSNGEGTLAADLCVFGANASLTMDRCIGEVKRVMFRLGNLTIRSGRYGLLNVICEEENTADLITLYGGSYERISFATDCPATAGQILGKGYRYDTIDYSTAQAKKSLSNGSVIPCTHTDLNEFVCVGCGMEIFLSVEANGEIKLFGTFEDAIRYAEQNEGCTVKFLQDLTLDDATVGSLKSGYLIYLEKGKYTIDLNGKTLDIINGSQVFVRENCDLTIGDSAGGKVISSSGDGGVYVGHYSNNNAKLTVTGGEFTVNVTSYNQSALVLKGGSFKKYVNSAKWASCSPFVYLSEGYTFAFMDPASSNNYANEGNVKVDHDGSQMIRNVTVVPVPLTIGEQPTDLKFYLTSRAADKYVKLVISTIEQWQGKQFRITFEKEDGTVIKEATATAFDKQEVTLSAVNFTVADSGLYRIKLELKGYVLYSDTFRITVAECEHPGYDRDNKCTQCRCDLAAAIVKDGKTTGYVTFADALAAAQTDENKGCVLWLLTDVAKKVSVGAGDFEFGINGHTIGGLNVTKTAKLNIFGSTVSGTINGTVAVAKTANLIASVTNFMGAVNDLGNMSSFINCVFVKSLNAKGSNTNLNNCTINGALNVSGNKVTLTASTVYGKTTVNNGGLLRFMGNGGKYGETLVKSGGGLEVYANNTCSGTITAQSCSKLTLSGGVYTEIAAESGAKLTISGGEFTNITVNGQHLIDCLAEGKAFEDMAGGFIIDGRVGIAGDVKVVDHTHTCIWKTNTHEKLCGCGYVEAVDTEAPVISGIDPENNHYGSLEFTVTDANDFTVWMDDEEITLVNGKYTMEPDNEIHLITATDVAGNTVSFRFGIFKTYHVTLSAGAGYTLFSSDGLTVRHGNSFSFIVQFNKGYSRTEDFKVLVNGNKLDELMSDADSASFVVRDVSEDLVITVEGVADITAPEVEVSIRGNSFKEFLNRITFGLFFKQTQTVEVKAHDFGSGIKKVEYLLSETAFADKDAITGSWTELDLNDAFKAYFSIEPSQKTFVYVRVTDAGGNITVINSDGVVVYTDAEAVTGAMVIRRLDGADASFAVRLNGNTVNAVCNGDRMLVYDRDYTVSENGVITLKADYLSTLAAGEYTIRVTYNPLGESFDRGDEPAMTTVKLTVEKRLPKIVLADRTAKTYDGDPIDPAKIGPMTETNGAMTWAYKPVGADDSAYTATAPKDAGEYTVRLTTAETDNYETGEATALFVIVQKEVTITGVTVADKVYDGTTHASIVSDGTILGLIGRDEVTGVRGKAAFDDKNVGTGKTVTFYDFALSGEDAANYVLSAQPAGTAASISARELTIKDLAVKDKQYDGKNTAEIDGTPALVGVVDGDVLELVNGVPTFDRVTVGKNIPVSFTAFTLSGNSVTVGNYTLTQPTGITASIVEYSADGSEYEVNSNDWINKDFVITAKAGYKLSLTDTANGVWVDFLAASDETDNGKLTFFVKNTETGIISAAVTETYKIDKTAPTGEVKLNERTAFQKFINVITFGLFFKDDVNVKLTAEDDASGVKSVLYFRSDKVLTDDEVRAITDWTDNSDFDIEAKDMDKFIIYVRIEDNAGNVTFIGSDGATFDTTAPEIVGIENGKTYYVTKKVAIDDENLESATLNGEPVEDIFLLAGDTEATYFIRAVDKAGNVTEYTVYMKPISSVTDVIAEITVDNVKSSDAETISAVERQILDIAEAFDDGESTEEEWNKLLEAAAKCKDLNKRIAEAADEITRLTDAVNRYDIDKVTSADKADIEKLIADIDTLLSGDNLTDAERADLEALKGTVRALLDRIAAAKDAAEADKITAVDGITKDNVKLENKEALEKAEKALEGALCDFDGNYTEEEGKDLEEKLETVKAALAAIGNAEKAAEEIGKLPSAEDARLSDKRALDQVKKLLDGLTENEKAMLGKDALGKVDALAEKIKKLAEEAGSPDTGAAGDLTLWFALLFISSGAMTGVTVVGKKKERSVK